MKSGAHSSPAKVRETLDGRPIVIVGCPRSGTTLLRLMLTSHPGVTIPRESAGLVKGLWWGGGRRTLDSRELREGFLDWLQKKAVLGKWNLPRDVLKRTLDVIGDCTVPEALEVVYRQTLPESVGEGARWGDKSTWYYPHIDDLIRLYPDCSVIGIVRDPRAVAASWRGVEHLSDSLSLAAAEWSYACDEILRWSHGDVGADSKVSLVTYEEIVAEPVRSLERLCDKLALEFSKKMLEYWRKNRQDSLVGENEREWKELTYERPRTERIDAWREELTAAEICRIQMITGTKRMKEFRYQPIDDCPSALPGVGLSLFRIAYVWKRYLEEEARKRKNQVESCIASSRTSVCDS